VTLLAFGDLSFSARVHELSLLDTSLVKNLRGSPPRSHDFSHELSNALPFVKQRRHRYNSIMNIFVLDTDPVRAAKAHCDKHVVKMILESGQMLCGAHWLLRLEELGRPVSSFKKLKDAKAYALENLPPNLIPPYKLSHAHHPCTVWTAASRGNYDWHLRFMRALLDEYTSRYTKKHSCERIYEWALPGPPPNIPDIGLTEHPQCMPDECKVEGDVASAYRNYYIQHKAYMAKWKHGNEPVWWKKPANIDN
jgi:hypothetical protein